jgi:hypothetical protein
MALATVLALVLVAAALRAVAQEVGRPSDKALFAALESPDQALAWRAAQQLAARHPMPPQRLVDWIRGGDGFHLECVFQILDGEPARADSILDSPPDVFQCIVHEVSFPSENHNVSFPFVVIVRR